MFMYVNKAKLSRPEVKAFVDFMLNNGGALIRDVGYVPLSDTEQVLPAAQSASVVHLSRQSEPGSPKPTHTSVAEPHSPISSPQDS